MKLFNQVRRYGAKVPQVVAGSMGLFAMVAANATDPLTDALGAIDLTAVAAAVGVIVLAIIGITLAFKGADLGKRAVRKV